MTIAIALMVLSISGAIISYFTKGKIEHILPLMFFSIPLILLPFYCLNILQIGKFLLLFILFAIILFGGVLLIKKKIKILEILNKFTPAVLIFVLLSVCFYIYLLDNLVCLWDELRLWGAVPKALFYTNELQLAEDCLIFPTMRSYPPGMALIVYFFASFSSIFGEHYIYICYALLASVIFLPALKNLKWKQWPLFAPITIFIAFVPCIFTSHGGDYGYFYESLFIDGLLGIVLGYIFFLASQNPFSTKFKLVEFCIASAFVVTLKDSAIVFSIIAIFLAFTLFLMEKKKLLIAIKPFSIAAVSVLMPYLMWSITLKIFNVENHLGFSSFALTREMLDAFWTTIKEQAMLLLKGHSYSIQLSFLASLIILTILFFAFYKKTKIITTKAAIISFSAIMLSVLSFTVGYIAIFGVRYANSKTFSSYQRYFSTALFLILIFVLSYIIPLLVDKLVMKNISQFVLASFVAICVIFTTPTFFVEWSDKYNADTVMEDARLQAQDISRRLSGKSEGNLKNIYLLMPESPLQLSQLHHRIYYELLGSELHIRNFCWEVNIIGESQEGNYDNFNITDSEEIKQYAEKWSQKLINENFDYIYVQSTNESVKLLFNEIGCDALPEEKSIYEIQKENNIVKLKLVEEGIS